MSGYWTPTLGETVWINHPDSPKAYEMVGFVREGEPRAGQPIIKDPEDGSQFATHPMFLLPFPYGGKDWQCAETEGRIA